MESQPQEQGRQLRRSRRSGAATQSPDDKPVIETEEIEEDQEDDQTKQRTADEEWALGWSSWTNYRAENETSFVPDNYKDKDLVNWVKKQREDYKNWKAGRSTFLSGDGFRMMDRMGFVWSAEDDHEKKDGASNKKTHSEEVYCGIPTEKLGDEYGDWPRGWKKRVVQRKGSKKTDSYWYSPKLQKQFRSVKEVKLFLDALQTIEDEAEAWSFCFGKKSRTGDVSSSSSPRNRKSEGKDRKYVTKESSKVAKNSADKVKAESDDETKKMPAGAAKKHPGTDESKESQSTITSRAAKRSSVEADETKQAPKSHRKTSKRDPKAEINTKNTAKPEMIKSSTLKSEVSWDQHLDEFRSFRNNTRQTRHSSLANANPELIAWAVEQKKEFVNQQNGQHSKLSKEQLDSLIEAGFVDFVAPPTKVVGDAATEDEGTGVGPRQTTRSQKRQAPPPPSAPPRLTKRRKAAEASGLVSTKNAKTVQAGTAVKKEALARMAPDERWDILFNQLLEYKKENGHCCVPKSYPENTRLSTFVYSQRQLMRNRDRGIEPSLSDDHLKRLEDVGFVFNTRRNQQFWHHMANHFFNDAWDENYAKLVAYKKKHGNTLVPKIYPPDQSLAYWVFRQRRHHKFKEEGKLNTLCEERIQKLKEVGFVFNAKTRDVTAVCNKKRFDEQWDSSFKMLLAFKKKHGHAIVPRRYKQNQTLAAWTQRQRGQYKLRNQGKETSLTEERIQKLKSVGFVFRVEGSGPYRQYFLEDDEDNAEEEGLAEEEEDVGDEEDEGVEIDIAKKRRKKSKEAQKKSHKAQDNTPRAPEKKVNDSSSDSRSARALRRSLSSSKKPEVSNVEEGSISIKEPAGARVPSIRHDLISK